MKTTNLKSKIMETQRVIISGINGQSVPVTVELNIKPLTHSQIIDGKLVKNKPVVNGNGRQIMNDEWIYVQIPNYGNISINVNRHHYCRKIYLQNAKITESIGYKKMTKRLEKFIKTVADSLVFERDGKSYRVYLKETKKGFDLDYVWPYWATCGTGGIASSWGSVEKKYGGHPGWCYNLNEDGTKGSHKLNVNLESAFGFSL